MVDKGFEAFAADPVISETDALAMVAVQSVKLKLGMGDSAFFVKVEDKISGCGKEKEEGTMVVVSRKTKNSLENIFLL